MPRKPPKRSHQTPRTEDRSKKDSATSKSKTGLVYFLLIGPIPFGIIGLLCIFLPVPYSGSGGGYKTPWNSFTYSVDQTVDFGIFFLLIAVILSFMGWRMLRK